MPGRRHVAAALLTAAAVAHAQQISNWEFDFDEGKKTWEEIQAQIPAYPKGDALVQVQAGNLDSHKFYLDPNSLALGADGVMRYTAVVKTTGGATNVSYEGIRCETRERKLYAIGRSDGSWVRARDPKWQRIELRTLTPHYYVLYRDYFCPARTVPTPPKQALEALKRGTALTGGPTSY